MWQLTDAGPHKMATPHAGPVRNLSVVQSLGIPLRTGQPPMAHSPGFLKLVQDAKSRVKECTVADVKSRMDRGEKLNIIDVREESEFAAGHIPGSVHLGKGI